MTANSPSPQAVSLAPCPMCGGEATLLDYEAKYGGLHYASRCPQCTSCGCSMGYLPSASKAIAAWNRRASPEDGVVVPREPMPEMIAAWYRVKNGHHFHDEPAPTDTSDYTAYRAMLAASPALAATSVVEGALCRRRECVSCRCKFTTAEQVITHPTTPDADKLRIAVEALEAIKIEANRTEGRWTHMKRVVALNCDQALAALKAEGGK